MSQLAQQQQQQQPPAGQQGGGQGLAVPIDPAGNIDITAIQNHPQIQAIRQLMQANPDAVQPILQQIALSNPTLVQIFAQHPEQLAQLLGVPEEAINFGGLADLIGGQFIELTAEEEAAIERVRLSGLIWVQEVILTLLISSWLLALTGIVPLKPIWLATRTRSSQRIICLKEALMTVTCNDIVYITISHQCICLFPCMSLIARLNTAESPIWHTDPAGSCHCIPSAYEFVYMRLPVPATKNPDTKEEECRNQRLQGRA